ncbi:MAG: hypothetical protein MUF45_01120 [Spirosomaceae bacterium]|nr:hypothetical protein [Spirosomataceae bacterium]
MADNTHSKPLSDGTMLVIFLVLACILYFVGDLLTFIVGMIVLTPLFAGNYNKAHQDESH